MGILQTPCLSYAQAMVQHKTTLQNDKSYTTASKPHDHTRRCNLAVYDVKECDNGLSWSYRSKSDFKQC